MPYNKLNTWKMIEFDILLSEGSHHQLSDDVVPSYPRYTVVFIFLPWYCFHTHCFCSLLPTNIFGKGSFFLHLSEETSMKIFMHKYFANKKAKYNLKDKRYKLLFVEWARLCITCVAKITPLMWTNGPSTQGGEIVYPSARRWMTTQKCASKSVPPWLI